ncbi:MAG: polysaccharide deacetylase family protein [Planctomycetia bacterium]
MNVPIAVERPAYLRAGIQRRWRVPIRRLLAVLAVALPAWIGTHDVGALEPIPDRLVVLTFDDAARSHYDVARPVLARHGFGATFFISEGWDFGTNKRDYMTWEQIRALHDAGFEIGNHTLGHVALADAGAVEGFAAQVAGIAERCREHGIPPPTSFAYPGNAIVPEALPVLAAAGIRFARRGGAPEFPYDEGRGSAYEPGLDHPLLVPSAGDARPTWTVADLDRAVLQAEHGRIAVLQFHGVPDTAHAWVNTEAESFERFMDRLAELGCTVIAMRDLARYVDPSIVPADPRFVIDDRTRRLAAGAADDGSRPAPDDVTLSRWLENALVWHRFTPAEAGGVVALDAAGVEAAATRLGIDASARPQRPAVAALLDLPWPGGRHPRRGFRDGAIRPQRETKVSVFAPWAEGGWCVVDAPEAVWRDGDEGRPVLEYLAHTHVPTLWDGAGVTLPPLEWSEGPDGVLAVSRTLPDGVVLSTRVEPGRDGVRMTFTVTNGTDRTLTGLRVQMCTMLAGLAGFDAATNDNKVFAAPMAACHDTERQRWIVTGWERCGRAWGNPPCPCLHADPVVADCPPGASRSVRGWLSFHEWPEGTDVPRELDRLRIAAFSGAE